MNTMSKYPAGAIVRRIDDLGRIVLGKELRRMLRLQEGDPMAMWSDNGKLVMEKYSEVATIKDTAGRWVAEMANIRECVILVSDRDEIVLAKSGYDGLPNEYQSYVGRDVSDELRKVMEYGEPDTSHVESVPDKRGRVFWKGTAGGNYTLFPMGSVIVPIKIRFDVVGTIVLYREHNAVTKEDKVAADTLAYIIGLELTPV
jgi:stage V sporulation protein T